MPGGYPACKGCNGCDKCRPPANYVPCDDVAICFSESFILLEMEFEDIGEYPHSRASGKWFYHPGLPGALPSDKWANYADALQDKLVSIVPGSLGIQHLFGCATTDSADIAAHPGEVAPLLLIGCQGDEIQMTAGYSNHPIGGDSYLAAAYAQVPIADFNANPNQTIDLTPWIQTGTTAGSCTGPFGDPYWLNLVSAKITIFGVPCEAGDPCDKANKPVADFSLDNGAVNGCIFEITDLSTSGSCDHICVYSDGHVGCGPRPAIIAGSGCGEYSGSLTQWVIDTRGCWDSKTIEYSCCKCDDAEGNACAVGTAMVSLNRRDDWVLEHAGTLCDGFEAARLRGTWDLSVSWNPDGQCDEGNILCLVDWGPHGSWIFTGGSGVAEVPDVLQGYAANTCVKVQLLEVVSDVGEPLLGCYGDSVCYEINADPQYPPNCVDGLTDPEPPCLCLETIYCCPDFVP